MIFKYIYYWPRYLIIHLISLYQKTLSLDHGILRFLYPHGYCRFYPTCSEYGKQAIMKYGVFKGGMKASWRVLRCNPWNKGGIDEV